MDMPRKALIVLWGISFFSSLEKKTTITVAFFNQQIPNDLNGNFYRLF